MGNYLFISDAAKEVKVESHVLRYWEEELHLPIKRNELGHRYYTKEDVERFKTIKGMKERGLQLKAIKMILKDGKLDLLSGRQAGAEKDGDPSGDTVRPEDAERSENTGTAADVWQPMEPSAEQAKRQPAEEPATNLVQAGGGILTEESKEEKSKRLQWLLRQLIRETLQENNEELCREIKDSVVKELDYQFRMQEEREELRDKRVQERDEEHYKKMDELLRKKAKKGFGFGKKKKGIS